MKLATGMEAEPAEKKQSPFFEAPEREDPLIRTTEEKSVPLLHSNRKADIGYGPNGRDISSNETAE